MNNKNENKEIIETSAVVLEEEAKESKFKKMLSTVGAFFKRFKSKKLKNQALLKRGGYSLAITAIVLAGLIVFNWLVGALSDRFHLEVDMTSNKKSSISEDNIKYIKGIEHEVDITVIGAEENFANTMAYYAQNYYKVAINSSVDLEYFEQTQTLVSKYGEYNDNFVIKYVDPQSTEFTAITTSYSSYSFVYGDILVTSNASGSERVKLLTFNDIYATSTDSTYAAYGYSTATLSANKLENALTSAIAYVTSVDTKNVAVLSGHSANAYTDAYKELLASNNYSITEISDKIINSISDEYDAVIISAPTIDFIGSELDAISKFLDNDGKLGKGLIYFADASCPATPNLYEFLEEWGIAVNEGMVFETSDNYHITDSPSTVFILPESFEDDDITTSIKDYISVANLNVPMNVCEASSTTRKATALMKTSPTAVMAPVGASADWADYTDDEKTQFDCVIQSVETDYDDDNNKLTSYVMAFSSVEFVQSTWSSYSDVCNQDIVMACTDRATHVGDTSITFTSKFIENESFASSVSSGSSKVVMAVFMFIIPILMIVIGITVYVRRRNAQ